MSGYRARATKRRRWRVWEANRRKELVAEGLSRDVARRFAAREAKGRSRVSAIVGETAAMQADVVMVDTGGDALHFYLAGR